MTSRTDTDRWQWRRNEASPRRKGGRSRSRTPIERRGRAAPNGQQRSRSPLQARSHSRGRCSPSPVRRCADRSQSAPLRRPRRAKKKSRSPTSIRRSAAQAVERAFERASPARRRSRSPPLGGRGIDDANLERSSRKSSSPMASRRGTAEAKLQRPSPRGIAEAKLGKPSPRPTARGQQSAEDAATAPVTDDPLAESGKAKPEAKRSRAKGASKKDAKLKLEAQRPSKKDAKLKRQGSSTQAKRSRSVDIEGPNEDGHYRVKCNFLSGSSKSLLIAKGPWRLEDEDVIDDGERLRAAFESGGPEALSSVEAQLHETCGKQGLIPSPKDANDTVQVATVKSELADEIEVKDGNRFRAVCNFSKDSRVTDSRHGKLEISGPWRPLRASAEADARHLRDSYDKDGLLAVQKEKNTLFRSALAEKPIDPRPAARKAQVDSRVAPAARKTQVASRVAAPDPQIAKPKLKLETACRVELEESPRGFRAVCQVPKDALQGDHSNDQEGVELTAPWRKFKSQAQFDADSIVDAYNKDGAAAASSAKNKLFRPVLKMAIAYPRGDQVEEPAVTDPYGDVGQGLDAQSGALLAIGDDDTVKEEDEDEQCTEEPSGAICDEDAVDLQVERQDESSASRNPPRRAPPRRGSPRTDSPSREAGAAEAAAEADPRVERAQTGYRAVCEFGHLQDGSGIKSKPLTVIAGPVRSLASQARSDADAIDLSHHLEGVPAAEKCRDELFRSSLTDEPIEPKKTDDVEVVVISDKPRQERGLAMLALQDLRDQKAVDASKPPSKQEMALLRVVEDEDARPALNLRSTSTYHQYDRSGARAPLSDPRTTPALAGRLEKHPPLQAPVKKLTRPLSPENALRRVPTLGPPLLAPALREPELGRKAAEMVATASSLLGESRPQTTPSVVVSPRPLQRAGLLQRGGGAALPPLLNPKDLSARKDGKSRPKAQLMPARRPSNEAQLTPRLVVRNQRSLSISSGRSRDRSRSCCRRSWSDDGRRSESQG